MEWFAEILEAMTRFIVRYLVPRPIRYRQFCREWLAFLERVCRLPLGWDREDYRYMRVCHDRMARWWRVEGLAGTGMWVGEVWRRDDGTRQGT